MIRRFGLAIGALATALAAQGASAHDFFLLPEQSVAPAAALRVKATIGSHFPKPEITVAADRIEGLRVRGTGAPQLTVIGSDATGLNLSITGAEAGTLVTAVSVKPRDVDYGEDRIPLILEEYRVAPSALAAIERMGKPRTLRAVSRRMAKAILCADRCGDLEVAKSPMGDRFEFVAADGAGTRYRLLLNGRPLGLYPVDLADPTGKRTQLKTDAKGEVAAPPAGTGRHMLFAAHMTPPEGEGRYALDLTSLTVDRR